MIIHLKQGLLEWGNLDLPLLGVQHNWQGSTIDPMVAYVLVQDDQYLWFMSTRETDAISHPDAQAGAFHADLWQYDVAELFITSPDGSRYFEFNVAANGAWWCCEFTQPRVRYQQDDAPMPNVLTFAETDAERWLCAIAIPLDLLRARLDFGAQSKLNATWVINYPASEYVSVNDIRNQEQADFHQPQCFSGIQYKKL